MIEMRVDHSGKKIMSGGDGVLVAVEVKVDLLGLARPEISRRRWRRL